MSTPTTGAMRAASSICDSGMDTDVTRLMAAQIIDRETGIAELVAALEKIIADSLLMPANQSAQSIADFNAALVVTARSIARKALAKAKGTP